MAAAVPTLIRPVCNARIASLELRAKLGSRDHGSQTMWQESLRNA